MPSSKFLLNPQFEKSFLDFQGRDVKLAVVRFIPFPLLELRLSLSLELCQPPSQTPGGRLNVCSHPWLLLKHPLYYNCLTTSQFLTMISMLMNSLQVEMGTTSRHFGTLSLLLRFFFNSLNEFLPSKP